MNSEEAHELERQRLMWSLIYSRRISTLKGNTIMALEQLIVDLTAALNANTAAILGNGVVQTAANRPAPAAPAAAQAAAPAAAAAAAAPAGVVAVAFDDLKKAFLALVAKNRDAATSILAKHGIGKLSEAKPEQHAAIKADIDAAPAPAAALV